MNIRNNINLIRGILCLYEVIQYKSINKAAEANDIKAANLSLLISNLEKQLGLKLLKRSPLGSSPTSQGLKIAQYAIAIREQMKDFQSWCSKKYPKDMTVNVFMATNLEITDYSDFSKQCPSIKLNFVDKEADADIKINNCPPKNKNASYSELCIGKDVRQKIWISVDEKNTSAMAFFDFIVAKLLDECGQSMR